MSAISYAIQTDVAPSSARSDRAAALRTLNAFAVDVMSIRTTEDLFWYVARNVVGRLNFVDCVIYRADEAHTTLVQVAALGEKNPYDRAILNPLRIPFGEGITGRAAASREPVVVDDLARSLDYIPDTMAARSEICVPLIAKGRVVGVIDSEHPEANAFGEAELEVLTTVAAMTSAKLELLAEAERSTRRYGDLVRAHAELNEEVSNRKALEVQLHEARKREALGRLTGGFAHQFNNLLTVISGNLDLVEIGVPEDEARHSIRQARIAADQGAGLIADMLAFSERMRLRPERVDPGAFVRDVVRRNGPDILEAIRLDLDPDLPQIAIDAQAAEIALVSLIANARDAMDGTGTLRIGATEVMRRAGTFDGLETELIPGRYLCLTLSDEGTGIAPGTLDDIFDPFFTTKPAGHGVGLGLAMVRGFMRQSGGAVRARNGDGRGATFDLYVPAQD